MVQPRATGTASSPRGVAETASGCAAPAVSEPVKNDVAMVGLPAQGGQDAASPSPAMSASVAGDRSHVDGDETNTVAALIANGTATSDDPKAPHDGAATQDAAPPSPGKSASVAGDRSQTDGDDMDPAAAPIADDPAKSDDQKAPLPPPASIEFKRRLANKDGGIAKRSVQLQTGAGDGSAAPPGSPPSARDRSGSGTAPRRATVAGGARSTGGGIATRTQKNGGGAGIVIPGAFEVSHSAPVICKSARPSLRSERKPAILPPPSVQTRPSPHARAHSRITTRPAHARSDESSSAPASSRLFLVHPVSFSSVLLRFSRCWCRNEASARGATETCNVGERRR